MLVDDLGQLAVVVVAQLALVVEHHQLAVLLGVGLPLGQSLDVRVAGMGELCPHTAHHVGQLLVGLRRLGQVAAGAVQGVEAELQLLTVDAALADGRAPREHIHPRLCRTALADGVGGDDGLRTEQPVDAQQILRRVAGIGLGKGADVPVSIHAERAEQLAARLVLCHLVVVAQALQLVERRTNHNRSIVGRGSETVLEGLLQQRLTVGSGSETPHHRRTRLAGAYAGGHGTLAGLV